MLAAQFQRLGAIAEPFAKGLVELKGGAAGYHMSQILKLASSEGVARVAEALRHAARYGAFDHNAVARILAGKPAKATPSALGSKAAGPKQLEQYRRGTGTRQRPVDGYRKLLGPPKPKTPPDGEEGHGHGQ